MDIAYKKSPPSDNLASSHCPQFSIMNITISIPSINLTPYDLCLLILGFIFFFHILYVFCHWLCSTFTRVTTTPRRFVQYKVIWITTVYEWLIIITYGLYNLAFLGILVKNWKEVDGRSRWLSVSNLILCILTGNNPYIRQRFRYETIFHIHVTSGLITFTTMLIHLAYSSATFGAPHDLRAITSLSALVLLIIFASFRSRLYELFLVLHKVISLGLVILLSLHIGYDSRHKIIYNSFLLSCIIVSPLLRQISKIYHRYYSHLNCKRHAYHPIRQGGEEVKLNDVICLSVETQKPMGQGGKYFLITLQNFSYFQSHPLFPVWRTDSCLFFLIKPMKGFSSEIQALECTDEGGEHNLELKVFLHGPYGPLYPLHEYGTVLLFATDIGITAVLSHLQELMGGRQKRIVRTQRILLYWEIKMRNHGGWVIPWLNKLIPVDTEYVRFHSHSRYELLT